VAAPVIVASKIAEKGKEAGSKGAEGLDTYSSQ